ncbi:MAG: BamA/TamA family outer membrane protein [bacterium]|nr:BamA/TamA family outer membrane protein [bacterium]
MTRVSTPSPTARSLASRAALPLVALLLVTSLAVAPAGGQLLNSFGKNKIQYRDFDWKIYHSQHFDIYYYETEEHLLEKTASFAESAYDELSRTFDYQIQDPTPLIVYSTHSAFLQNNVILNGIPEGVGAFATSNRFRMVLPLDLPDPQLMALIRHELTHIFQYHILSRGKIGAGLRGQPPQWFMEGMASYFGDDETPGDRKFMVDAVVNDNIPSVQALGGGFFAYRYGHAVFDYIEERWGKEAVLDLIYEFRNTLGSRIGKAIERTFRMDVEDFDAEFRRWARQKYLPTLLETGEPGDFGKPFRLEPGTFGGQEFSPAASPSGDLVASITTDKGEVDVSLFDAPKRRRIRTLTKGFDRQIKNISVHTSRQLGSDLAFSPDGNYIAAFARREGGFSLILIDVINGGLSKIIDMEIEQQRSPSFHPDGQSVVFGGNYNGQFDIFAIDLDSYDITNLTNDEFFDAAPAYSPDGRWLTYTSFVGEYAQIFRASTADLSQRYQLTSGEFHNKEPAYSAEGDRIYFTSNRTGADNIFGLDLERKELTQYTNAVTGCDRPTVLPLPEGGERLVYSGYWKGRFDLFMTDVEEPLTEPVPVQIASEPAAMGELERYEPDIEVTVDEDKIDPYGGFKFFLEDAQNYIGVDSDQVFIGRVLLSFTDYLGDRRIILNVAAVDALSDFDAIYFNQRKRQQWAGRLFDRRVYAFSPEFDDEGFVRDFNRNQIYGITGAEYLRVFPLSFNRRFELTGGAYFREFDTFSTAVDSTGDQKLVIAPRSDVYPQIRAGFVSDTTIYNNWGPVGGHRVRMQASWAPDFDKEGPDITPEQAIQLILAGIEPAFGSTDSSTLVTNVSLDARKYLPVTRRMNFAFRFFGYSSTGNAPEPVYIGGLDTIRGFNIRSIGGFRAFYGNVEFRFPLIDQLVLPFIAFQGIRGNIFFDIGGAWFPEVDDFDFVDDEDRLEDAIASYGFGLSFRAFGMNLNWDFAKRYDLKDSDGGFETGFWIGNRF